MEEHILGDDFFFFSTFFVPFLLLFASLHIRYRTLVEWCSVDVLAFAFLQYFLCHRRALGSTQKRKTLSENVKRIEKNSQSYSAKRSTIESRYSLVIQIRFKTSAIRATTIKADHTHMCICMSARRNAARQRWKKRERERHYPNHAFIKRKCHNNIGYLIREMPNDCISEKDMVVSWRWLAWETATITVWLALRHV